MAARVAAVGRHAVTVLLPIQQCSVVGNGVQFAAQRGIQRTVLAVEVATAQPVADEAGAHPHTWLRIYSDQLLLHRVLPPMPLCGNAHPVPATCTRILLTAHWEVQQ